MTKGIKNTVYLLIAAMLWSAPLAVQADDEENQDVEEQLVGRQEQAPIELGAPFGDHAVLQREMDVPVWGWSKPGAGITVEFGGQKKTAKAGADGKWMLTLAPLKASYKPAEMLISDGQGNKVTIKNILVGEVWMASGQSNMQWKTPKTDVKDLKIEPKPDGVAPIREFEVTSVYAQLHPIEKASGSWKNGDYSTYSAIALAFAHKLHQELDVPVGILNCSFSQTSIQAWVPRIGFRDAKDEYSQNIYKRILETDPSTPEHKEAWAKFYQELEDGIKENEERAKRGELRISISSKRPGNLNGNRDASWMYNGRLHPVVPYAIRGAIWNQGYANMGEGLVYYNNLHSMIRGWRLAWDAPELPVYFHQFYTPGNAANPAPTLGGTAEMRLGTWLARDIPNTGMASQIDVGGSIHYSNKKLPGQRLALHALKNQYGKKLVADGPMYKAYKVEGDKLIVEFEHAEGGLVVAQPNTRNFAKAEIIENGDDKVTLFYIAGEDRVWHPANMKISGEKVILTAPDVKAPRGVSYAAGGVAFLPNLYNRDLLPMTPFIYYDNELVLAANWPDTPIKIAGVVPDASMHGLPWEYRRMPLLSTQFRDNAVLQAGVPVTIWGGLGPDSWREAKYDGRISFRFAPSAGPEEAAIVKTVAVAPGMTEWQVTLPAMQAGDKPYTLKVAFSIDGELVHERTAEGIVFGDVFYVAVPAGKFKAPDFTPADGIVRVIGRKSKRDRNNSESRFSIAVSTQPGNRFAAEWKAAENSGLAAAIGHRIAAKTGKPVGIIYMQSGTESIKLSSWIPVQDLKLAPSMMQDYRILASRHPWGPGYADSIRQYVADYKKFWQEFVPEMITTRAVPDGRTWGAIPAQRPAVDGSSEASQTWNTMVSSFTPTALKGIIFLAAPGYVDEDQGEYFASELTALVDSWRERFALDETTPFFFTIPGPALAAKVSKPTAIKGAHHAVEITDWSEVSKLVDVMLQQMQ